MNLINIIKNSSSKRNSILLVLVFFSAFSGAYFGNFFGINSKRIVNYFKDNFSKYSLTNEPPNNISEINDKDIITKINQEIKIENNSFNQFNFVSAIREWVSENIPVVYPGDNLLVEQLYDKDDEINLNKRLPLFLNGEAGAWCGETANTLREIYELFGFESYTVNMGFIPQATHVVTLVKIKYEGKELWSIQDAYFNNSYMDNQGKPLGYYDLLMLLVGRKDNDIIIKYGANLKKSRIISKDTETSENPYKIFDNGNKFIKADLQTDKNMVQWKSNMLKILKENSLPDKQIYLFLLPFEIYGSDIDTARILLRRAQAISGTWCHNNGECWGLE